MIGYALAGAAQGLGEGIVSEAKAKREAALKALERQQSLADLESQREFVRSERLAGQEFQTASQQRDQEFKMQQINATAAAKPKDAPTVQKLKLDDGSEVAVQWNDQTGKWDPIDAPTGGRDITPKNKLTESQSKLTLFQNLQTETQPVLLDLENQFNPANIADAAARSTPIAGNFFRSEEGQIYEAAATAWAEGALRIATGAAATPEEMERTKRAYFAQPGDTPTTIAFKAQMREMYNRSIEKALGSTEEMAALPKPSDFVKQFARDTNSGREKAGSAPPATPSDVEDLLRKYGG